MPDQAQQAAAEAPYIRLLIIQRFRGIEKLVWRPNKGVNVLLGGGDDHPGSNCTSAEPHQRQPPVMGRPRSGLKATLVAAG
jgi:hypothetical protein